MPKKSLAKRIRQRILLCPNCKITDRKKQDVSIKLRFGQHRAYHECGRCGFRGIFPEIHRNQAHLFMKKPGKIKNIFGSPIPENKRLLTDFGIVLVLGGTGVFLVTLFLKIKFQGLLTFVIFIMIFGGAGLMAANEMHSKK